MISIFRIAILLLILLPSSYHALAQETPAKLKVMTYNIWNGFDWGKDTTRQTQTIQWIKDMNPDVLALQELCGYDEEKLRKDAIEWGHPYVKILKTKGYPVGLTSKQAIKLKERALDELWHGMLHCETYGIDFFVVHLSPSDRNFRLKEAQLINTKIKQSLSRNYLILGDFNSLSPFDFEYLNANESLLNRYANSTNDKGYVNLYHDEFDYSVMATFLGLPTMDAAPKYIPQSKRYTFPTPALIGTWQTKEGIQKNRQRIDYILSSPSLYEQCKSLRIFNDSETALLSDHYPQMAEYNFNSLK